MASLKGVQSPKPLVDPSNYNLATTGTSGTFDITTSQDFYTTVVTGLTPLSATLDVTAVEVTVVFATGDDLSEVMVGSSLTFTGTSNFDTQLKVGYEIKSVDDTTKEIVIEADRLPVFTASSKCGVTPLLGAYAIQAIEDFEISSYTEVGSLGAANMLASKTITAGTVIFGNFTEVVLTSGSARLYLL